MTDDFLVGAALRTGIFLPSHGITGIFPSSVGDGGSTAASASTGASIMDNTGGAIINERMRVLLLGKHTGSTRFEHSVLPGRWGGAAASSGQSRSGGGSPGTEQGGFGDGAAFSGHMGSGGGSPGSSTSSTCLGAGLAAATGQLRSGGGSPGLQGVADSTGVAGGGDESSWSRAGDWGGAAYEGECAEYYAEGDGGGIGGDEPGDAAGGFYNAEGDVASSKRGCADGKVFGEGDCGGDDVRGEAFRRRGSRGYTAQDELAG